MIFDAPLLLLLAPALGLALGFAAWLGRRRRIRLARRLVARARATRARARHAGRPLVLGLARCSRHPWPSPGRAGAGPRSAPRSRALSLVFAVDISRSMLAEDASPNRLQRAVREARRLIQDLRGRPARPHRLRRAGATSWRRSRWMAARSACTSTRSIPTSRAKAARTSSSVLAPGRPAPRRHHRRGRPGAGGLHRRRGPRHADRHRPAGRGAQGGGRPPDHGGRGRRRPPRASRSATRRARSSSTSGTRTAP